jgi:SAM-dependent methyltransferase
MTKDGYSETEHLLRLAGIMPQRALGGMGMKGSVGVNARAGTDGATTSVASQPPRQRRRTTATDEFYENGEPKGSEGGTPGAASQHVLDFGYGNGHMTRLLRRSLRGLEQVHGIEVSREQAARAHANSSSYDIVYTSHLGFGKLPYREGFFGAVVSQQAFSFCPDRSHTFAEMYRILRPGGVLVFQDIFLSRAEGVMLHARPVEEAFGLVLGTIKEYKNDLAKAGFIDVKVVSVHDVAEHIDLQSAMTEKSASGAFRPSSPQVRHPELILSDLEPGGEMFRFADLAVANALAHNALGISLVTALKPIREIGQPARL